MNGFTLLRQAYDATEPGFDGHVSVPTLWDRTSGTVASNQFTTIGIDLATQFRAFATPSIDTYPAELADDIEALDAWIGPAVNKGVNAAAARSRRVAPLAARSSMRSPRSTGGWPATASCSASTSPRPTSGCS